MKLTELKRLIRNEVYSIYNESTVSNVNNIVYKNDGKLFKSNDTKALKKFKYNNIVVESCTGSIYYDEEADEKDMNVIIKMSNGDSLHLKDDDRDDYVVDIKIMGANGRTKTYNNPSGEWSADSIDPFEKNGATYVSAALEEYLNFLKNRKNR